MPSIEANGEQIYFLDEGVGPVVFFIHSLGTNSYLFREQILAMKRNYRCVAPDCRGMVVLPIRENLPWKTLPPTTKRL